MYFNLDFRSPSLLLTYIFTHNKQLHCTLLRTVERSFVFIPGIIFHIAWSVAGRKGA